MLASLLAPADKELSECSRPSDLDDPINLIKDIYKNFSISLDDRTLSLMNAYIEEGSSDAKAEHKYSLEDYGLERAEVHNKLNYS